MSRKGTNLTSVRVLMARPVAIRDGPRAISNHNSLVNPEKRRQFQRPRFLQNILFCFITLQQKSIPTAR